MPPLIPKGPRIPPEVFKARQEGKLVFFCGAGVSLLRAGLPLFGGLVDRVYEGLGLEPDSAEKEALRSKQFDRALESLEGRTAQGLMRAEVARLLSPTEKVDLSAHRAILDLSLTSEGKARVVTTNFDLLFEAAAKNIGLSLDVHSAPVLPVPKPHKWFSLVHLHGSLGQSGRRHVDLVLNSADFGIAYLVERWASRFITELFRQFSVVFVGYDLNDPVLRYLTDALATERDRGISFEPAFAFARISARTAANRKRQELSWQQKSVKPIFYTAGPSDAYLYKTLLAWASLDRSGLASKRQLAISMAATPPEHVEDDYAQMALWALSDELVAYAWATLEKPAHLGMVVLARTGRGSGLWDLSRDEGPSCLAVGVRPSRACSRRYGLG